MTAGGAAYRAPERLTADHDVAAFRNGRHPALDDWLRERALSSEGLSARTYVICPADEPARVVGYYALATAMEQRIALPTAKLRRGMPEQVPLLLLGRLAIDQAHQGRGIGTALLSDALSRCLAAADIAGARGVITHAIDDAAAAFYTKRGFLGSPLGESAVVMPMETIWAVFELGI